ncbi:hypothetical protein DM480_08510 [Sphingomonas sp. FARSPH]|nr:hypothetical protein DM480_08510 [Sphingomonas sp. FARSPH]
MRGRATVEGDGGRAYAVGLERQGVGYAALRLEGLVIPAQAGIQRRRRCGSFHALRVWIPACAGMTAKGACPLPLSSSRRTPGPTDTRHRR